MGKNQSASNLTNIIKQDANGSIAFMSGSTMLMALSNTGQMSGSAPAMSAVTASYADNFTVKGTLTAQTIVSQVVTSSTSLITGSTIFGTLVANTHQFTGSLLVSGSNINITSAGVGINTTPSGYRLNVAGQAAVSNILVGSGYRVEFADAGSTSWAWLEGSSYDRGYSYISFNTSGSEKMRLTSTGLLGIGTTTPANFLHINGLNPNLIIQNTTSSVGSESNLTFRSTFSNGDIAYLGYIRAIQQSTSQNTGDIAIHAYSTGSANEAIRIQGSTGNIGIGTTSPNHQLAVYNSSRNSTTAINAGNSNTIPAISIQSDTTTWSAATNGFAFIYNADNGNLDLYRKQGSTTQSQVMTWVRANGNVGIGIVPQGAGSAKTLEIGSRGIIYDNNDNFLFGNNGWVDSGTWKYKQTGAACIIATNGGQFTFSTAASGTQNNAITWSDKFIIQNGGNVGIGTSPNHKLDVNGDINIPGTNKIVFNNEPNSWFLQARTTTSTANLGSQLKNLFYNGGGVNEGIAFSGIGTGAASMEVRNDGRVWVKENLNVGGTITESSSIRYKTNVETVKYGLDKVLQLRGVTYDKKDTGIKELGLIAEEVNEILPDVVIKNEEGEPDSVSYGRLTAVLIEAVKDLQAQINELKAK